MTEEPNSNSSAQAPIDAQPESSRSESEGTTRNLAQQGNSSTTMGKKRVVLRLIVLLLLMTLAVAAYLKRGSLLQADSQESSAGHSATPQKAELKVLYWQDPMHPSYKSDKPGKAPDCGMDLVPVYEGGPGASNLPEGAFQISTEKQQLIGVTYGEVSYGDVSKTVRAVARLAYDETKIVRIHPKIDGWIENVYVDFTGKEVERGQPLISIYSPDLVSTQQEYLLAKKGLNELSESPFKEAVVGSESLFESAKRRLELWDITDEQIKELEQRGSPAKALTLYAPTSGFVLTRNAYPKQRVTPESELYQIADLSSIWAIADFYEYEAPEIQLDQPATMTLSYYPGKAFRGRVSYIYPQLDNATRTLRVRIDFPNPALMLKPDMYANVDLKIDYGRRLFVPQEAVLDSGSEQTVFVSHEGGYFEPRKVELGAKVDNKFIVLAGLKQGERIVTSANFLIDSESRLKSAASGMGMPGMSHGGEPPDSGKPAQTDHSQDRHGAQPREAQPAGVDHSKHQATPERKVLFWYDPMHPDYKSDKPGKAPDCGMDLVPKYADIDHSKHQAAPERKVLYWYDPMHPDYKSDKPGKAPDCGMDLVPMYADGK
jgi:Cu(I)/Ag(I) efflux system membrane fusion protein